MIICTFVYYTATYSLVKTSVQSRNVYMFYVFFLVLASLTSLSIGRPGDNQEPDD